MPPDPDNIAAAYADAFAGETVAVAKDMMGQLLATFAEKDATIAAQAEAIRVLREACEALFAAPHHEHFSVRMSDGEYAAIEQIRAALAATAPKEPTHADQQ